MTKYVVFLRGVNVGGRIIRMADVKTCLEKAGFKNVRTVLQTGNVILETPISQADLKAKIQTILSGSFDYPAIVQVVAAESIQSIIDNNPFSNAPADYHQYVIFIENDLETKMVADAGKQLGEEVKAGEGVVYWSVKKGDTLSSPLGKLLTKSKYKDFNTNRNMNTIRKINDLLAG